MRDLNNMTLGELRKEFPGVKSNSKSKFIDKVMASNSYHTEKEVLSYPENNEPEYEVVFSPDNSAPEFFPEYLIEALRNTFTSELSDREIFDVFMHDRFDWTPEVDKAIIHATWDAFSERVKITSCSVCLLQRRDRLRKYYGSKKL